MKKMLCFLVLNLLYFDILADWLQISTSFTSISVTDDNWNMYQDCQTWNNGWNAETDKCANNVNQQQYIRLTKDKEQIRKSFTKKNFQVKIIFDLIYDQADAQDSNFKVQHYQNSNYIDLYNENYKQSDLNQQSNRICAGGGDYPYRYSTIVSNVADVDTIKFGILFCLNPKNNNLKVGIRNLLIYANNCYPTCLTCSDVQENKCSTCYDSVNTAGGKCTCIDSQQFAETGVGCRQECARDYSIARSDKICVPDRRIVSLVQYFSSSISNSNFPRYSPFSFIEDKFHYQNTDLVYDNCNSIDLVGQLYYSEGMELQLNLDQAVKFLRIRVTIYFFYPIQNSKIELQMDNIVYSKIVKTSTGYSYTNFVQIFLQSDNQNCNSLSYTRIRVETIIKNPTSNPLLKLQGEFQQGSEYWGFHNFTIDTGYCQENCLVCSDFYTCSQCQSGFILYGDQCVTTCPIYSSNCVDYEDIIPYSRYLAKGFYDLNMTIEDIKLYYDSVTDPGNNFKTGQVFSFIPEKIVLGGMLVWTDSVYTKSWAISKPHYAITLRFNLTFGDGYTGSFSYKVDTQNLGPYSNPGGGQNIIGRSNVETTKFFYYYYPFQNTPLTVEFNCAKTGGWDIRQEFCAISEYFLVVHYCQPFCQTCTDANTCSSWQAGHTSSNCPSGQYLYFNTQTSVYSCELCSQTGCNTCINQEECTQCLDNTFDLSVNGQCICKPYLYLSTNTCLQCNKYCETCYGNTNKNCITCNEDYHRSLEYNQCLCQPGYYDDGKYLPCLNICGDQIVVDGEQCDDGNYNPYDGCHECKLTCNWACDICIYGKCYLCKDGYQLNNNSCFYICHDNILALPEQCDNYLLNCVNCQFKCSDNCSICEVGICKKCNESIGWYLQTDGSCREKCGDSIITSPIETCDDNNSIIKDGCHQCSASCDVNCQFCINSKCSVCIKGYFLIEDVCYPQCNDSLIVFSEICEDGNKTPYDGCFNCQFSCSLYCINCVFGVCKQCDESNGWYLNLDGSCKPVCGDIQQVELTEICDDGNSNPFDGCNQCMYSCGENCSLCYYGRCIQCSLGYFLQKNQNKCLPYCGDGIQINYKEICDDGNTLQYDGCYSCQLSCQNSCTECSKYGCNECNTLGWELNNDNNQCQTICGDGIVIPDFEECDDLEDEGCYLCKYQCQESCKLCIKGRCYQCKQGWYLNTDAICAAVHGDSKIVGTEQCDDWNQINLDGCYMGNYQCQDSCQSCNKGICQICFKGYYNLNGKCKEVYNDGIVTGLEICDDNNLNSQDGCFSGKYDCPKYCSQCLKGICVQCLYSSGYGNLDIYDNKCLRICGDGIQTIEEECDDGNTSPYDGCYQCQYQCDFDCEICDEGICKQCNYGFYLNKKKNKCQSFCGDGIVTRLEYCDDANKIVNDGCADCQYKCHQQCVNCVEGKCFDCNGLGWQINLVINDCQPICGDGLVIGNEQCDDANDISEDGCYECYFDCQKVCTYCDRGYCQECNTFGWQLVWNRCQPICGDKQVIGHEECDDGNIIPYDGCYECKYQCQEQCTDCQKGICYACDTKGWEIIDNQCYAKCGDGYVVEGQEECDDGNSIQFDGCYKCYFQCEEMCTQCEKGICYECNILGWDIENHTCLPFCGDGIVVGYEQCDDMNDDFNDGCYKCMYACDQYCQNCQQGVCLECELGRFAYQNVCQAQCGDGFYVKSVEQCDDGNLEIGDGCDKLCRTEKDWTCINIEGQFSNCFYSVPPEFQLDLQTKTPEDFEDVQLTFNQQVKLSNSLQGSLEGNIHTEISNLDTSAYSIVMSLDNQIQQNEISEIKIQFKISFYIPIEKPIFKVAFKNDPIMSEFNLIMTKPEQSLQLLTPMVLSDSQKQVAQSAQVFNQAVIYSLVSVSALCVLSGSSETFWNLMDQLQYLSYIKYININFPNNLNMYFDVFKLITISPLMAFFGIDKFFDALDGDTSYFVQTEYKFLKDEINAYFFLNFQSFLFCLMSAYGGYWATKYSYLALYKLGPYHMSKLPIFVGKAIYSTRKALKEKASQFYLNGIIRILMSNTYDLSFACAIQLAYYPVGGDFTLILNYYVSFIVYMMYFGTTIYIINILSNFSKQSSLKSKPRYEALFEGLSSTADVWKIQHNAIQMIKKQLFITLIVFMQNDGQIQTLCIAFVQSIFLSYLYLNKPLTNLCEYIKNVVTETLIIFNTISFLFYAYRVEVNLTLEGMINLGWIHILTSTMILGVSLVLDLYQQFQLLLNKIKAAFFKQEIERVDSIQLFY